MSTKMTYSGPKVSDETPEPSHDGIPCDPAKLGQPRSENPFDIRTTNPSLDPDPLGETKFQELHSQVTIDIVSDADDDGNKEKTSARPSRSKAPERVSQVRRIRM